MHARCGNLREAKRVLEEMNGRDIVSYNTLISAFSANEDGVEMLNLFSKMKEVGIEPDRVTYTDVLTACSCLGLLEEDQRTLRNPSADHYSCLDDILS